MADFGLSKRIEEASKLKSKVIGVIPYVDPIRYGRRKNSTDQKEIYLLNSMSDVYSVGVLLWEISSGQTPFCDVESELNLGLAIVEGARETSVPDTPIGYSELYTSKYILYILDIFYL